MTTSLSWLPSLESMEGRPRTVEAFVALANHDLDFIQTLTLDKRFQEFIGDKGAKAVTLPRIRLAILATSTIDHLLPSIRIGALRRGLLVDTYIGAFNQIRQELYSSTTGLDEFRPDAVLFCFDTSDICSNLPLSLSADDVQKKVDTQINEWKDLWAIVRDKWNAVSIHSTLLMPTVRFWGEFDGRVPASDVAVTQALNAALQREAAKSRALLLDVEGLARRVGTTQWFDSALWHHAKQAVAPTAAPLYGEHVGRILAALRGLSKKCLVLDLDNVLWGGVIGDDGLEGIEIGQGNAVGEAYAAFQKYLKRLKECGVILAVCSKNEESNALLPFEKHPDMVLRREDFAEFIANWTDKATNIEALATKLNIGLDALVFFDDNPVERALIRQSVPGVAVPEVPEDPSGYAGCLSDAGYFEAVQFSAEDAARTRQYASNIQREQAVGRARSLDDFLKSLNMEMEIAAFDETGLPRITQLINKSNQFNLTTRRYTETQVRQMMHEKSVFTYQARLKDNYGDNGMISVVIAKPQNKTQLHLDTWLMSCRVLGRQVEHELLNRLVADARRSGFEQIVGEYIPTDKNHLVRDLYALFGFKPVAQTNGGASHFWKLDLASFSPHRTFIKLRT